MIRCALTICVLSLATITTASQAWAGWIQFDQGYVSFQRITDPYARITLTGRCSDNGWSPMVIEATHQGGVTVIRDPNVICDQGRFAATLGAAGFNLIGNYQVRLMDNNGGYSAMTVRVY